MSRYLGGVMSKTPNIPTTGSSSGVWTLEEAMLYTKNSSWPVPAISDPYIQSTKLLLKTNGIADSTNNTFIDSSPNNFSIARTGNVDQGTFTPYVDDGKWSCYFNGSGDWGRIPYTSNFDLSSGDWTMECWFKANSFASALVVVAKDTYGSNYDWSIMVTSATTIALYTNRTNSNLTVTVPTMSTGVWYHVAYVRSSGINKIYLNGVSYGQNAMGINNDSQVYLTIGCSSYNNPGGFMNGFVHSLRIVKGTAVYTGNFDVPTSPLTAIAGTSLLTCQDRLIKDNSAGANVITKFGDMKVIPSTPFFTPTADLTKCSGGFDGAGDYLYISPNAALAPGTGDFGVQLWIYLLAVPSFIGFCQNDALVGSGNDKFYLGWNGTALVLYQHGTGGVGSTCPWTPTTGQWYHLAASRVSGTTYMFINGVAQTVTGSTNLNGKSFTQNGFTIGAISTPYYTCGFMADFQYQVGTGFTTMSLPASPISVDTNAKVMCKFTNAGIYDASSGLTVIETSGTAKVSTAIKKHRAAIYLDGSSFLFVSTNPEHVLNSSFTIETWVRPAGLGGSIISEYYPSAGNTIAFHLSLDAAFAAVASVSTAGYYPWVGCYNGSTWVLQLYSPIPLELDAWSHLAVVYNGTTVKLFINGFLVTSSNMTWPVYQTNGYLIGRRWDNAASPYFTGYVEDMRITRGVARYTGTFTPPGQLSTT